VPSKIGRCLRADSDTFAFEMEKLDSLLHLRGFGKSPAVLLAALFRRRFVVAHTLLSVGIAVVALIMTLEAVRAVALVWTRRRVRVLHDGVLRASEVVDSSAGALAVLVLAVGAPWIVERNILWARLRL